VGRLGRNDDPALNKSWRSLCERASSSLRICLLS
jgi:hypothetical protein